MLIEDAELAGAIENNRRRAGSRAGRSGNLEDRFGTPE